MHKCPNCGQEFEGKFCPECGAQWQEEKTCPQCGATLAGAARFCNECGYSFIKKQQEEKKPSAFKQKLCAAGSVIAAWFKKVWAWIKSHLKIVIPVASALVVIITVSCVLGTVLPNKFRVGKVSKIELGYTQEQVLKILGEPYADTKSDYKWEYFDDSYFSVLDKIAENDEAQMKALLSGNESKLLKLMEEELKLKEQLETMAYKYIEVNFLPTETENSEKIYTVSSVYLDMNHSNALTETKKEIKEVKLPNENKAEYYYDTRVDKNSGNRYLLCADYYSTYFKDGSYYRAYFSDYTTKYIDMDKSNNYRKQINITWSDRFVDYNITKEALQIGRIDGDGKFILQAYYSITELTIPTSVERIDISSLVKCEKLKSINVSVHNESFSSINGVLYNKNATILLRAPNAIKKLTIPDSVTSIGSSAFEGCSKLTSITIPDSVTSIGSSAFEGCSKLTSITIPDSVKSIGSSAFSGCSGLTSIEVASENTVYHSNGNCIIRTATKTLVLGCKDSVIPTDGSVTSIGSSAFSGCSGLTSITIPDSVTSIGDFAFAECSKLTSITISDGVTSIGDSAFFGCDNLKFSEYNNAYYLGNEKNPYFVLIKAKNETITECVINNKTKIIYYFAFAHCEELINVTIPDSVKIIGNNAFYLCNENIKVNYVGSIANLCELSGDATLWEYGRRGLYVNGEKLTGELVVPVGVTHIGDYVFSGCRELTSVTIPDGVTSIGYSAFENCRSLTSVTIPDSVISIDYEAFRDCSKLKDITYKGTKEQWNAIKKDFSWNRNTGDYTIHCTDGDIAT